MHDTYTRWMLITLAVAFVAAAGPASAASRPAAAPDGDAAFAITAGSSGEFIVTADAGELHVEKSVFADGSTMLVLRSPDDEVRIAAAEAQISVTADGVTHRILPGVADGRGAEGVRVALARSGAVGLFQRLRAQVESRGPSTAFDHAVLMSGALVSQLSGDTGAIARLARAQRGSRAARIRPARLGQFDDCWYHYEVSISRAHDQFLLCLGEGGIATVRAFLMSYCEIRYMATAESLWFQYLSCSSIRVI